MRPKAGAPPPSASVLGRRILLADMGNSTLPPVRCVLRLKCITWQDVRRMQEESQAGLILACGAHFRWLEVEELFPGWCFFSAKTNGSLVIALAHPSCWEFSASKLRADNSFQLCHDRAALCICLRRVTARSPSHCEWMKIVLTKVHLMPCGPALQKQSLIGLSG